MCFAEQAGAATPKQNERTIDFDAATPLSDEGKPMFDAATPTDSTCATPRSGTSTPPFAASCDQAALLQQSTSQAGVWQPDQQAEAAQAWHFASLAMYAAQPHDQHFAGQVVNAAQPYWQPLAGQVVYAAQPHDQHFAAPAAWWPQEWWWPQAGSSGAGGEWQAPAALGEWCGALRAGALDRDPEMQRHVLAAMRGQVPHFAFDKEGCRLVQWMLENADKGTLHALLTELDGRMLKMMQSPHANYVAQKVFEVLPAERMGAVIREFAGQVERVARHRYGCRILIQLLAHCLNRAESADLVDELLSKAAGMVGHPYAHHALEAVLEHGREDLKHRVVCALSENLLSHAQHHHGSFVVLAALTHCSDADARWLCGILNSRIVDVTAKRPGCNLYRELCTCTHPRTSEAAVAALRLHAPLLRRRAESRRLVLRVLGEEVFGGFGALEADASTKPSGLPLTAPPQRTAWADAVDDIDVDDISAFWRPEAQRSQ